MRKRWIFPVVLALSVTMVLSGISVYAKARTSVENAVETGAVRIRLTPSESHFENILPGQLIDIKPVIKNEGYDCYIRTTVGMDSLREYLTAQNTPDEWIQNEADGYWYYPKVVKSGESVAVFDGLLVGTDLPQELAEGKTIRLLMDAEAVQAVHFTPDFTGENPWGGVKAEAFAGNGIDTEKQGVTGSKGLSIRYEGKADQLIADPGDFFSNLPVLMPGDTFEQTIRLKNDSKYLTGLYFYTEAKEGKDFLEKVTLKIKANGKQLYYGTLASPKLEGEENAVLLADLGANATGECTYTVSVPKSLKNEFTLKNSSFVWTFMTKNKDTTGEKPKNTPSVTVIPRTQPAGKGIQTGDGGKIGLYLMLSGFAMLILAVTVKMTNGRKENQ